jgi:hypothetical protein
VYLPIENPIALMAYRVSRVVLEALRGES